jgi:hypothetical protein
MKTTIRNLSPSTKKIYVYAVAKFSRFHGRSPDKLTMEDVRDYRLHLIAREYQAIRSTRSWAHYASSTPRRLGRRTQLSICPMRARRTDCRPY